MNLISNKWISYKNKKVSVTKKGNKLTIENKSNKMAMIFCSKVLKKKDKDIELEFKGNILYGEAAILMFLNRKKEVLAETTFNSKMLVNNELMKYYLPVIKVHPKTKIEITKIEMIEIDKIEDKIYEDFKNDTLVITPSYPSEEHRYLSGFVHSRIEAYKKSGLNVDVAVVYDYKTISKYNFEGINVTRMGYNNLRNLLQTKKYKKILIHFFDEKYFNILEGCNIEETEIFVWVHGPETLYWDYPKFTTQYFRKENALTDYQVLDFKKRDAMIKKINDKTNIKWIFVSEWIKNHSEKLLNIKFNNFEIIPNIIDMENFKYEPKKKDKMKKIFILRRYDNINKYAVDVSVRTILELSKRDIFNELEFNIYGNGDCFDQLFEPIKGFKNVNFYKQFLTHTEIAKIHKENGIALFPTRYDAQGVSMCEAGSSGLLVVSSENDAIKEFIPYEDGNIIETENYKKYADFIENICQNEKLFNNITKKTVQKIKSKCSFESTVKREIELIKKKNNIIEKNLKVKANENPVLSIIIPSYNVSKYIEKTLFSLIDGNDNAKYLEILVVNDGSKDNTKEVVKSFIKKYCNIEMPIVKLIDKENGGHGSTINVGIEKAKGKYTRIIDGDDWVNTNDLSKLIEILKKENTDIVVTNYCEDLVSWYSCDLIKKNLYDFMIPGLKYDFDDLCIDYYGFPTWGPILATANILTNKLREANFKLSEKTFYVDMEYNSYYLPVIENIVYYDLDIYRYFIGRVDQSISLKSFVRNVLHHEKVINNILRFLNANHDLSDAKRNYIHKMIVWPMITAHYLLLMNTIRCRKSFIRFDKMLKENLSGLDYNKFSGRVKLLRKTKGFGLKLMFYINVLRKKI